MKKNSLIQTLKVLTKNMQYLRAVRQLEKIRMILVLANIELGKKSYRDSLLKFSAFFRHLWRRPLRGGTGVE